jgi:hypothetical protein
MNNSKYDKKNIMRILEGHLAGLQLGHHMQKKKEK